MPTYVHRCTNGHEYDVIRKVADYNSPSECSCGASARRILTVTMISPDIAPWDSYISPASGKNITSYKERKADMKATGCEDYEPSIRRDSKKNLEAGEAKLEKEMDNTVDEIISKMPSDKKEKLFNEVKHSEVAYTRL